jgi:type I restriction enzyme S subunit
VGWEVKPLKHLTAFATGWTPPTGREDLYDGDHLWANIGDLGPKVLTATEKTISDAAVSESRMRIAKAGSLLFSFKLSVGTVSIAGSDMYTNEAIAAFPPSPFIDTQYLYWAAPLLVPRNAQENIYGAPLLSRERIANARLLNPPLPEQRAIATFLDRETARIDALVAKNERLIELLQEKRTALISRVVTKGLDPQVPMRDSGIEWLGEIPVGWSIERADSFLHYEKIQVDPSAMSAELVFHYSIPSIQETGDGVLESPSEIDSAKLLITGTRLLVSKLNPRKGVVLIASMHEEPTLCSTEFVPLDVRGADLGWSLYLFLAESTRQRLSAVVRSATRSHQRAEVSEIVKMWHAIPPLPEQRAIATFLNRETARFDALIAKVRIASGRLKELRTSLISAAVTGKIDVRGEAA